MTTVQLFTCYRRLEIWRDGWVEENGMRDIEKITRDRVLFKNGDDFLLIVVNHPQDADKLRGLYIDEFEYYDGLDATDAFWEAVYDLRTGKYPKTPKLESEC